MPTIEVKTNSLETFSQKSTQIASKVGDIQASFTSIISALDWDVKSSGGIETGAARVSHALEQSRASLKNTANFLSRAKVEYEKLDNIELPDALQQDSFNPGTPSGGGDSVGDVGKAETGETGEVDWLDLLNAVLGTSSFMKDFVASFQEFLSTALAKATGTEKIGSSSGSGTLFSVVCNLISNYTEFQNGDISVERMIAEMGVEFVLSKGLSMLLGPHVTLGLAGFELLIGTSLVELGSDAIIDLFTLPFDEFLANRASDFLDVLDNVSNVVGNVTEVVGEVVTDVVDTVVDVVDDVVDKAKDVTEDICDAVGSFASNVAGAFASWW